MKIILLKDVEKIGKKYEVKNVSDGHARNLLIPRGLAKPATKEALAWLEMQKEIQNSKAEEELKQVQDLASRLEGSEVSLVVKIGDEDQMFESINAQKVAEKLKEMGYDIKKTQIIMEAPIKELGEFPIKVRFSHNLEVEIRITITGENKDLK
jgi:large subunit ribosomal protein L9